MSSLPSNFPGAPIQIVPSGTPAPGATPITSAAPTPSAPGGLFPLSSGQGILPPTKWLVAFVVMSGGLLLLGENDKYGEIATGLAWLAAVGAFTWNYQAVFQEIDKVFGTTLATQFSAGGAPATS